MSIANYDLADMRVRGHISKRGGAVASKALLPIIGQAFPHMDHHGGLTLNAPPPLVSVARCVRKGITGFPAWMDDGGDSPILLQTDLMAKRF